MFIFRDPLPGPRAHLSQLMDKTAIAPRESLSSGSFPVSRPPLIAPPGSVSRVVWRLYNALRRAAFPQPLLASGSKELDEIRQFAATPSDIDEHLERMFTETLLLRPKLIVELGVRGGASTFVFERAAALCSATLVSVDIDDCSAVSHYARWHFVRGDDVAFAARFQDFCRGRNIAASIDLLFIDTSHYYEHTVREIQSWFPLLSPAAKVMFHDTNMGIAWCRRDGCIQWSWNNHRGVTRAIEEHLHTRIDETKGGVQYADGWLIRHVPYCNGFTILDRVGS